jgi:hypothetical protein
MGGNMPDVQMDKQKISGALTEFKTLLTSKKFSDAIKVLEQDQEALAKAKANPKSFLRTMGIALPNSDIDISQVQGDAHTICITKKITFGSGRFKRTITVKICTTFFL